jgi:Tfp pilus assembly protein PilV
MEAFFVVVVAVAVLAVGVLALYALRRLNRRMEPADTSPDATTNTREN